MSYCLLKHQLYQAFVLASLLYLMHYEEVQAKSTSFSESLAALEKPYKNNKKVILNQSKDRFKRQANVPNEDDSDEIDDGEIYSDNNKTEDIFSPLFVGPVCPMMDLRNDPASFRDLENCTIVDGFVQMLLFNDHLNESKNIYNMDAISFPKLRVITQYLLIYRVHRLTSLKRLFPNLVMIGGQKLFWNYALIIYENPDLIEIGLHNMQYITNGSVRIENNGKLCYLNTIDWSLLGKVSKNKLLKNLVIRRNNAEGCINQCATTNCSALKNEDNIDALHCWGVDSCQIEPYDCNPSTQNCICHNQCLGGCTSPDNATACYACRKYYFNQTCVEKCPPNTHLMSGWRCVEEDYCREIGRILHDGQCLPSCPPHHRVVGDQEENLYTCERCNGTCYKECIHYEPARVTNRVSLRNFNIWRCTKIIGQLIISDIGLDVLDELEEGLGELQEVDSLMIRGTSALTSLSFFKSLKLITGKNDSLIQTGHIGYSVYILNNERLRDLWNFESTSGKTNLTIGGGKAFFHFNPYLCLDKIKKIENLTPGKEDAQDVSATTNGDRVACSIEKIQNFTCESLLSDSVILKWKAVDLVDPRTLIGYHVYYKRSKFENASRFDENADGTSSWSKMHVDNTGYNVKDPIISTSVFNLSPFTKYAFYISTYTIALATTGAMSDIKYFTTEPSASSIPLNFVLTSLNYSAISLSWEAPQKPNGNITYYIIRYKPQKDDFKIVNQVNTCLKYNYLPNNPQTTSDDKLPPSPPQTPDPGSNNQQCCSCNGKTSRKNESEIVESARFEDYLIDTLIYWQLPIESGKEGDMEGEGEGEGGGETRRKRSLEQPFYSRHKRNASRNLTSGYSNATAKSPTNKQKSSFTTLFLEPEKIEFKVLKVNETSAVIGGLVHFTEYYFEIQACNHAEKTHGCGAIAMLTRRTKKKEGVDVIASAISFKKEKINNEVVYLLSWSPPAHPNSFIKNYILHYFQGTEQINGCCPAMEFNRNHTCKVVGLEPGTYHVEVQPVSLAGPGLFNSSESFEITQRNAQTINLPLAVSLCVGIAVLTTIIAYFYARKRFKTETPPIYASVNPEYYSHSVYVPDEYELPEDHVTLLREIGQGHFGKVFAGYAKEVVFGESQTNVAVKTLHGNETPAKRVEFLKEATVMKAFNSHHVVRLLGVVSTTSKPMVVMEYMEKGDLKSYLRSTRPDAEDKRNEPLTLQQKLQMCGEIADGMAYLAANKFVHRDLAARNCLVHENSTVKIGDFGLTRDVYETDYYRIDSRGILPVRWMAPESLKDGVFDSRSDVWSYGIVLWEIANLAEQPYQGQEHGQVTRFVIDGGYMEQPKNCPKKLYDLMLMCWDYSPSMRPTFMEILTSLSPDLNDNFKKVSYFYEPRDGGDDAAEDDAYLEGSLHSSDPFILRSNSGSSGRGDAPSTRIPPGTNGIDNYRLLNGGVHTDSSGEQPSVTENKDSMRYVPRTVQTHRQASTTC